MVRVQPLFLPSPLVAEHALVLGNDFTFEPKRCCYGLHTERRSFGTYVINAYDRNLTPAPLAEFSRLYQRFEVPGQYNFDRYAPSLSVTPEGLVVLSTEANRCFLFDAETRRQLN